MTSILKVSEIQDPTNSNTAISIDANGNVGIHEESPTSALHVKDGAGANIAIQSTAGSHWRIGDAVGASNGQFVIRDHTNSANRMLIDADGDLLIGTTSYANTAIVNVGGNGVGIHNGTYYRQMYQSGDANFYFNNGSNQAYLSSAGSWTNASDARLKTNIRDIEYGLSTVVATQPRHFERTDVDGTYIGFVAQELQTVIPEVVSGDPDTQLGVDYGSLVAIAFKAIQEQQETITALEARIAELESN